MWGRGSAQSLAPPHHLQEMRDAIRIATRQSRYAYGLPPKREPVSVSFIQFNARSKP
jgi:hypothetical protein